MPRAIPRPLSPIVRDHHEAFYLEGLARFSRRHYWACHEALEEIWKPSPRTADPAESPRLFLQAIIQAAAGFHHLTETGRARGAHHQLGRALGKLAGYPSSYWGIDIEALRRNIRAVQDYAATLLPAGTPDPARVAALHFILWPDAAPEASSWQPPPAVLAHLGELREGHGLATQLP